MSSNKQYVMFLAIVCFILSCFETLTAQSSYTISNDDIPEVADLLLCEYPDLVDISEEDIIQFLEDAFYQSMPGQNIYPPPNAELLSTQLEEISFQWESVPLVSEYVIRSLGLATGTTTETVTEDNSVTVNQLEGQLYLFAFASNAPNALSSDLSIIIVDRDLGFAKHVIETYCYCDEGLGHTVSPESPSRCSSNQPPTIFSWTNVCPINRYVFTVSGTISGQVFEYGHSFLYEEAVAPQNPKVYKFLSCTPYSTYSIPSLESIVNANVNIELTANDVRFELLNNVVIDNFNVKGKMCGCLEEMPRIHALPRNKTGGGIQTNKVNSPPSLQVSPNPFTEELSLKINLPDQSMVAIQIFDIKGRLVLSETKEVMEGGDQIALFIAQLDKGMYYLQFRVEDMVYQQKVIKL